MYFLYFLLVPIQALVDHHTEFRNRWRKEYPAELRESHHTLLAQRNGEVVVIHDKNLPRGQWQLGRIQQVIRGSDVQARGVRVKTQTKTGRSTVL